MHTHIHSVNFTRRHIVDMHTFVYFYHLTILISGFEPSGDHRLCLHGPNHLGSFAALLRELRVDGFRHRFHQQSLHHHLRQGRQSFGDRIGRNQAVPRSRERLSRERLSIPAHLHTFSNENRHRFTGPVRWPFLRQDHNLLKPLRSRFALYPIPRDVNHRVYSSDITSVSCDTFPRLPLILLLLLLLLQPLYTVTKSAFFATILAYFCRFVFPWEGNN